MLDRDDAGLDGRGLAYAAVQIPMLVGLVRTGRHGSDIWHRRSLPRR